MSEEKRIWAITPYGYLTFLADESNIYLTEHQAKLIIAILEEKDVISSDVFIEACKYAEVDASTVDIKYLYNIFIKELRKAGYIEE